MNKGARWIRIRGKGGENLVTLSLQKNRTFDGFPADASAYVSMVSVAHKPEQKPYIYSTVLFHPLHSTAVRGSVFMQRYGLFWDNAGFEFALVRISIFAQLDSTSSETVRNQLKKQISL